MKHALCLCLCAAIVSPLMAASQPERDLVNLRVASGELLPSEYVTMDSADRTFCISGVIYAGTTVAITFVLTEECCNWQIDSCPSDETDTYFQSLIGPGVNYTGVDDPGYCPRDCTPNWNPDVMNAGNATSLDGTPVRDCLPAGTYVLTLYSYGSYDPATCQPVDPGAYTVCINCNGGGSVDANEQPAAFALAQNFPNPFNPSTEIEFSLAEAGPASLKVYDLAGQAVVTLVDGMTERGQHSVTFDASALNSGVYFYTLQANGLVETKKMVLVK